MEAPSSALQADSLPSEPPQESAHMYIIIHNLYAITYVYIAIYIYAAVYTHRCL